MSHWNLCTAAPQLTYITSINLAYHRCASGGGLPDRLPAESEPVPNLCDAPVGSLCSGFDRAARLALAAIIHFFSTDVARWATLRKAGFLTGDALSKTVRWTRK